MEQAEPVIAVVRIPADVRPPVHHRHLLVALRGQTLGQQIAREARARSQAVEA